MIFEESIKQPVPGKITEKMPVLFLGHGSPMNAIEDNEFTDGFKDIGEKIPLPKAIICISAHWETYGTFVTASDYPDTIHDFWGFPEALYNIHYPSPGSPELATKVRKLIRKTQVKSDLNRGLDHGAWSVIKHMYPKADIPLIQLSLDRTQAPHYHYNLARELISLRKKGILIIGSGNIVHNLRMISWEKLGAGEFGYDWALEVKDKVNSAIQKGDHSPLINYTMQGKAFDLAIPTPEHFLPLLYILALKEGNEELSLFNDKAVGGSLTMTSVMIG
jgi:4,5-DOPA dioxygenase extradiol